MIASDQSGTNGFPLVVPPIPRNSSSEHFNITRVDISTLASVMKVGNNVINKRNQLDNENLNQLSAKLKSRIGVIRQDTGGISGFFRYLFNPALKREKQRYLQYMHTLNATIVTIIKSRTDEPIPKKSMAESRVSPILLKPISSPSSQPFTRTALPSAASASSPQQIPQVAIDQVAIEDRVPSLPEAELQASPSLDAGDIRMAPPMDDVPMAPPMDDVPMAPPMDDVPMAPSLTDISVPPEKLFNREPLEPLFNSKLGTLTAREIEEQIPLIESYIASKKAALGLTGKSPETQSTQKALTAIRATLAEQLAKASPSIPRLEHPTAAEGVEQIKLLQGREKDLVEAQQPLRAERRQQRKRLRVFTREGNLTLTLRAKQLSGKEATSTGIFYASEREWEEANATKSPSERIPDFFQKSYQVRLLTEKLKEIDRALAPINRELENIHIALADLARQEHTGLPLDQEAVSIVQAKINTLEKWESALTNRKNKLKILEKQSKRAVPPPQSPGFVRSAHEGTKPIQRNKDELTLTAHELFMRTSQTYAIVASRKRDVDISQFLVFPDSPHSPYSPIEVE